MNDYNIIKYKSIKLWMICVGILTLLYCIYYYSNYESFSVAYFDKSRQDYLRSHTPAHPPPLGNFMDPPDIFSEKYIELSSVL